MAQIKKIVKPGDLIRGAKVGPAALDKDGNVITLKDLAANAGKVLTVNSDGTVSFQDVPSEFPDGAQTGDVLAWGGDTGAEWRPHYPESGREGDVLTLGETGPEWAAPGGGGISLFNHHIIIKKSNTDITFVEICLSKDSAITVTEFLNYLIANGANSENTGVLCLWNNPSQSPAVPRIATIFASGNVSYPFTFKLYPNGSANTDAIADDQFFDHVTSCEV